MAAGPLLNALRACLVTDAEERELLEADLDPAAEGSQEVWRVWETLAEPWVSLSSSQCDDVTCPSAAASSREADDTAVTLKGHVCGDGLHHHQTHASTASAGPGSDHGISISLRIVYRGE